MYFLIDYENVNYAGLEGTEFLEKEDTVSFFYSDACTKIVAYRMKHIEESGCNLEICKLKSAGKNALDFYIASKIGEILAVDHDAKIAIISADKDYKALIDYWKPRLKVQNQFVLCKSLAKAINSICGEGKRKNLVKERMCVLDLVAECAKYEERKSIANRITKLFLGTDYENSISQIVDMVIMSDKPKELYLNSLKTFGRTAGMDVFRMIRKCEVGEEGPLYDIT